jgi:hypothetical protein
MDAANSCHPPAACRPLAYRLPTGDGGHSYTTRDFRVIARTGTRYTPEVVPSEPDSYKFTPD